jgi:hypothetical protein
MKQIIMSMAFSIAACSLYAQPGGPVETHKEIRKERHAQKITLKALEGKEVSTFSQQQFAVDFGNVPDVAWSREAYFDKASFINSKGVEMSAYYDIDGQLVGTTSPATFNDLPAAGKKEIMKHFADYQTAPVIFYDDNEDNETDMILYGMQFDDADNYFIELVDKKGRAGAYKVDLNGNVSFFADMTHLKH